MESFGEICRSVIWSDCRKHYLHQFVKINLWRTAGKSGPFLEAIAEIQTKTVKKQDLKRERSGTHKSTDKFGTCFGSKMYRS